MEVMIPMMQEMVHMTLIRTLNLTTVQTPNDVLNEMIF